MHEIQVKILMVDDMISNIGKTDPKKILKSVILNYKKNLHKNIERREKRRNLVKYSESFIKAGIILISVSIILVILIN